MNCAIGDAAGAACEYADEMIPQVVQFDKYYKHPTHGLVPGTYTDDTQMSLALAELMLEDKEWTKDVIAEKFYKVFRRDQRDGYSRGFQIILNSSTNYRDMLMKLDGKSTKSGAAMRAAVIGLYPIEIEVITKSAAQARITHDSAVGIQSAMIASLVAHALYYKKVKIEELPRYINSKFHETLEYIDPKDNIRKRFDLPYNGKINSMGLYAPCAAITDLSTKRSNNATDLLRLIFERTGDTDTAGAIGMSLFACEFDEIVVPDELYYGLENSAYGREYLEKIDRELTKKFPRN